MEERDQPSHQLPNPSSLPQTCAILQNPPPIRPLYGAGTYIVQVPKDQVFRIPPPDENEQRIHQNLSSHQQEARRWYDRFPSRVCIGIFVVILVVIAGISAAAVFLTHESPGFLVQHVMFKKPPPLQFVVRLKVKNPNNHHAISFDQGDSVVTLSFKQKEIAEGKFPIFHQDPGNTTTLDLSLHGSKLPDQITKTMSSSTSSKIQIPLSLEMNIGMRFRAAGSIIDNMKIDVSCSLLVGRLDEDTQILSQDCRTS